MTFYSVLTKFLDTTPRLFAVTHLVLFPVTVTVLSLYEMRKHIAEYYSELIYLLKTGEA